MLIEALPNRAPTYTPRYSCVFISRFCPRACSYCLSRDVRGAGHLLSPAQWAEAFHILEGHGVVFHLILGNELFSYPDPVGLVKALKPFHGRYAIYTTFPPGLTERYLDDVIDAGVYNLSGGVDVHPGLLTGDLHIDRKSDAVLYWLDYARKRGVPDVHATATIHAKNYDKLEPLFDLCTKLGIWTAVSMVEASTDGKHDFYGTVEQMKDWLIPETESAKFRDTMYHLAEEVRKGRWMMQVPPGYFEEAGDREVSREPWHCSLPTLIAIEEDGALRACGYRGGLDQRYTVFDLRQGGGLTMPEYIRLQQEKTRQCPGCGQGAGWSYWYQSELYASGLTEIGDKVFQTHFPGYEFEEMNRRV
jgi:MoaA/NifB/PqqE/SkfB family radical SAM enzyme